MFAGPVVYEGEVQPGWIDFNGHMNVAYYVLAFDLAVDALWLTFGMDERYRRETRGSTFAVESHVRYLRELASGDPFVITATVVGHDAKRIHQFQRMYHAVDGYLAATCEWMNLHVDLSTRRVSPWPPEVERAIAKFAATTAGAERPDGLGSVMGIPER
ncbi:MAG: thioesterase family protein [Pseudomonadota bacterium]